MDTPAAVTKSRSVKKTITEVFFKSNKMTQRVVLDTKNTVIPKWYTEQCLPKITKLLRTFEQIQKWTFRSFIMTLYQLTVQKLALNISPMEVWNCLSTLLTLQAMLSATMYCSLMWKWRWKGGFFSGEEDFMRAWDNECDITAMKFWRNFGLIDWYWWLKRCIACDKNYIEKLS